MGQNTYGKYLIDYLFEALSEEAACTIATKLASAGGKVNWTYHGYFDDEYDFNTPNRVKAKLSIQGVNAFYSSLRNDTNNNSSKNGKNGYAFEEYCADLLKNNGFINVTITPESKDKGVDILAEKYSKKYAIQ